jgi:hypothetical protein
MPVIEPPLPEWVDAGGQPMEVSPDLLAQMAGPDLMGEAPMMSEDMMAGVAPSAPAGRPAKMPKDGMAFDMRRLAVQTQEEYDALEPELKEVLKMMRQGMQFSPEGVAQFVMERRKAMTPEAQAQLARSQAQAQAAGAIAQEKESQITDRFKTAAEDFNYLDTLLDKVREHPGFSGRVGWQGAFPSIPGTEGADFDVLLDQIKGKQFMQAYQTLKGGGQITEVEGQKATDALARLNRKQSERSFLQALDEYQGIVRNAATRAREKLPKAEPQQQAAGAVPSPAPGAGGAPMQTAGPASQPAAGAGVAGGQQPRRMTAAEYKAATGRDLAPGRYKSKGSGTEVIIVP